MKRVLVLGSSGSGKSTVSRRLGEALGVEVIHLDSHFWLPNWVSVPEEIWPETVAGLLQREAWVIDGNYTSTLPLRLAAADSVVFLDVPRRVCLWRCLKRLVQNWGQNREELAPGCYEKMDWAFFKWIWDYPRVQKPHIFAILNAEAGDRPVYVLKGDQIEPFLENLRVR